jgi:hypothetical protein
MMLPRSRPTMRQFISVAAVGATLLGIGFCLIHHAVTGMQIAFADEQTAIFEQMRRQSAESESVDVGYLDYAVSYYPSGTKQTAGSALDRVVERSRQSAVREIIAILRSRTGKDLGDDPRRWIEGLRTEVRSPPPS